MVLGGIMVGWLPGMTSGAATTVCSPWVPDGSATQEISSALRFIRLYSAISAFGAIMSVGALFVLGRARSGSMDAVSMFLGDDIAGDNWAPSVPLMCSILLAMVVSSLLSYWAVNRFLPALVRSSKLLCTKKVAVCSLVFVTGLCLSLTGVRGAIVMAASTSMGLLPPLIGARRVLLMGSLLVPIWMMFVGMA
jgi:putative membrane protein